MKDRIVEYPHRFTLMQVSGQPNTFDLVAAPGIVTEEGTPLNKENLLSDEVASQYGLFGDAATVNNALFRLTVCNQMERLTSSQLWISPITGPLWITIAGAGGGGASALDKALGGGGGSAGAIKNFVYWAKKGEEIDIIIGVGGAGGVGHSAGRDGGSSIFGKVTSVPGGKGAPLLSVGGGSGGGDAVTSAGGAGGNGGGGTAGKPGELADRIETTIVQAFSHIENTETSLGGKNQIERYSGGGGGGGSNLIGRGGNGGDGIQGSVTTDGQNAVGPSAGGGGGGAYGNYSIKGNGGFGGDGLCIIRHGPVDLQL
ncbi:glycine-rich domain-containing protein [Bacilliculturomica massiliensis]|uniref:glycine-rich domain-containing protein n=1 Tax=Bacilliculturomica massiliensis TaxID=1917867 RepID=UPI00102FA269|nr:hypothetical protein [Bacilliculturomica massiliensis]